MRIMYEKKNFRHETLVAINTANEILEEYAEMDYDLTLRQLYYQHVARGLIANNQREYNRLGSMVNDARMAGYIDWDHIVDRTRNVRTISTWEDPSAIINGASRQYAIDLWANQPWRPEVWIEKDALVGVIEPVCRRFQAPSFSCRGYTSQSEMWGASRRFLKHFESQQKVVVFHLGDHDPSGIDMTRDIEERLFKFLAVDHWRNKMEGSGSHAADSIEFIEENFKVVRLALNWDQVEQYSPPPNPAKMTDSRAADYVANFGRQSWELDALSPPVLGGMIGDAIGEHITWDVWEADDARGNKERELLVETSSRWDDVVDFLQA